MVTIAGELLGLLWTAFNIVDQKAELDVRYFEQFIRPTWEAFEKVHEDYKASFGAYMDMLSSDNFDVNELINKIRNDSIQTQDYRADLAQIIKNLPPATLKTKGIYLSNFAESIFNYFNIHNQLVSEKLYGESVYGYLSDEMAPNIPRFELIRH